MTRKIKVNKYKMIGKYLPILIILLSITIMVGSTFAYFTDKKEEVGELTFSKVELSSETTIGIDGELRDVIPGTKLVDGEVAFSKAIDSEAVYVRAKVSFSLPKEYENDADMNVLLDALRSATDFNIVSSAQYGAVWSAKQGNYFYLIDSDNTSNLMRVDTIDKFVLSSEIVVPRDLKQLNGNAQYMKSINFHVAFEAIQADNVSSVLSETKVLFDNIFPQRDDEIGVDTGNQPDEPVNKFKVTFKGSDLTTDIDMMEVEENQVFDEPRVNIPLDENGISQFAVEDWFTDRELTSKYEFGSVLTQDITLYPKTHTISQGLAFTEVKRDGVAVEYKVAKGTCNEPEIAVPSMYNSLPVTDIAVRAFQNDSTLLNIYLPNTIRTINTGAFDGCTNLVLTKLPSSITSIQASAFYGCVNLALTKLPERLLSIGNSTFYGCANLMLTELPSGITSIGSNAFQGCVKLSLTKLPEKLKTISILAFGGCSSMTLIYLPSGITSIGVSVFASCSNLNYILCESEAVANLAKGKGREDSCIFVKQAIGYESAAYDTEVIINDSLTIYTADIYGYKCVRNGSDYYKCIYGTDPGDIGEDTPGVGMDDDMLD